MSATREQRRAAIESAAEQVRNDRSGFVRRAPDTHVINRAGQALTNVHAEEDCSGPCAIHSPSDHHMQDWPLHWRNDRGLMERICPHGVGHPDPDHLAHTRQTKGSGQAEAEAIHGCDGCCHEERTEG